MYVQFLDQNVKQDPNLFCKFSDKSLMSSVEVEGYIQLINDNFWIE